MGGALVVGLVVVGGLDVVGDFDVVGFGVVVARDTLTADVSDTVRPPDVGADTVTVCAPAARPVIVVDRVVPDTLALRVPTLTEIGPLMPPACHVTVTDVPDAFALVILSEEETLVPVLVGVGFLLGVGALVFVGALVVVGGADVAGGLVVGAVVVVGRVLVGAGFELVGAGREVEGAGCVLCGGVELTLLVGLGVPVGTTMELVDGFGEPGLVGG